MFILLHGVAFVYGTRISNPGDFVVYDEVTQKYYRGYFSGEETCLATEVQPEEDWMMERADWQPEVEILDDDSVLVHS